MTCCPYCWQGVVKVGAVNCDEHQDICSSNGVKGYPTIKAFVNGKGIVYNGQREVKVGRSQGWAVTLTTTASQSVPELAWGWASFPP
jgi:hypothetical protein